MTDSNPPEMRGPTKFFFEDENVDRLFAMVLALGAEITKVDEKLDTLLRLLDRNQVVPVADVQAFEPNAVEQAARDATRKMFIENLLAPFQQAADALVARAARK